MFISYCIADSSRYQVPGFPGYMHMRSNPSPEPESCALELWARARALLTRFGEGRYAVTHRTSSRTRARIRVARLRMPHLFVHTAAEVYQVRA